MITANIGRSFLRYYNQKNGLNLSAKEFFEQVFFKLFFDHPKYLYWVTNSPFVQMKKGQKPNTLTTAERLEKLEDLHQKIENKIIDASTAIGFSASEIKEFATTSGQVTDLAIETTPDTVYLSWIGGGLGIGVGGGQVILFDNPVVFDALFQGWQMYRDYLNDPAYDGLSGNKINSWNGQWLAHALDKDFDANYPYFGFSNNFENTKEGNIEIPPQSWLKVILAIARKLPQPSLTGYIYKHGQTNSTYGFIPFNFDGIKTPPELYVKLFGEEGLKYAETLYGTAASFQRICQMGAVGVAALEPKGLKDIMKGQKSFKFDDKPETQITFNTYLTWTLAMLNNDEIWDEAGNAADLFYRFETFTKRAKDLSTSKSTQIGDLFAASSKAKFMVELDNIIKSADTSFTFELENLARNFNKLPSDSFYYFKIIVSLRYSALRKIKSIETK